MEGPLQFFFFFPPPPSQLLHRAFFSWSFPRLPELFRMVPERPQNYLERLAIPSHSRPTSVPLPSRFRPTSASVPLPRLFVPPPSYLYPWTFAQIFGTDPSIQPRWSLMLLSRQLRSCTSWPLLTCPWDCRTRHWVWKALVSWPTLIPPAVHHLSLPIDSGMSFVWFTSFISFLSIFWRIWKITCKQFTACVYLSFYLHTSF